MSDTSGPRPVPGDRATAAWARARLLVWPERYVLASFPVSRLPEAAALVASSGRGFAALVVERDEVSATIEESVWLAHPSAPAAAVSRPYRAITIDVDVELDVNGFLAPVAVRLAAAGVSIVPQCAFKKDHLLVHDADAERAVAILEDWIRACRDGAGVRTASRPGR